MKEFSYSDGQKEEMDELIFRYESQQTGKSSAYFEEEAFEKIIEYYESREEFRKAMKAVEAGMEQYPYSSSLLVKKADLLLDKRHYQEALDLLDKAYLFDKNDIDLYILKTEALLALDRQDEAVELLQLALDRFEGEEKVELLFELADVYDDFEDFDKVFDCIRAILTQEPTNEEALYKICFWTDFTGRNAESIELHQRIIDDYPYNELAWFNLGAAYQGIKLYEKAIDAYKYAIAIDEKFDYAYRNIGDAYIRLRKYRDAIENLEKVLELTKPEMVLFEAIGYCYEKINYWYQSRFYYRKASDLVPGNAPLFYKVAFTYFKEQKWEAAVKQLEVALKIKRNKAEFHLLMGECKLELGFAREAVQYFMNAVRIKPKSRAGWEALIHSLYKAEDYELGLDQLQVARLAIPGNVAFIYYQSLLNFAIGRRKQALHDLEEGLSQSPGFVRRFIQFNPSLLQDQKVTELIIKYKRKKKRGK